MRALIAAVIAVPVAVVLLVGAALSSTLSTAAAPTGAALARTTHAGGVEPFTGASTGCTTLDPTGTGGCVTPAAAWLYARMQAAFGPLPTSCWDAHAWNPGSDHPRGRACDVMFGQPGRFPDAADTARGWAVATWLRDNADYLHVAYVIWQGRMWSTSQDAQGWRAYTGGGVYDPSDPTGGHYDHVHVSTRD